MLDARVSRPNFFRRNPRMLMTMGLFLVTAAILLFTVAIPSSIVLGEAVLLSLAGAAAIVSTCVFLFKMGGYIASLFDKQDKPVKSLPAFPWENEHSEDNSFTLLTKLSCDPSSETIPAYSAEQEVLHYPSPLKSNVVNYDHKAAVIDEFSENSLQPV